MPRSIKVNIVMSKEICRNVTLVSINHRVFLQIAIFNRLDYLSSVYETCRHRNICFFYTKQLNERVCFIAVMAFHVPVHAL